MRMELTNEMSFNQVNVKVEMKWNEGMRVDPAEENEC